MDAAPSVYWSHFHTNLSGSFQLLWPPYLSPISTTLCRKLLTLLKPHNHRWELEHRLTGKLKALPSDLAPSSPQPCSPAPIWCISMSGNLMLCFSLICEQGPEILKLPDLMQKLIYPGAWLRKTLSTSETLSESSNSCLFLFLKRLLGWIQEFKIPFCLNNK